jgi:putative FmdB family regulatory protein
MPYWDMCCPKCGFEIVNIKLSLADSDKIKECPNCKVPMEKRFDTMNFIKKGSGWTANSGKGRSK